MRANPDVDAWFAMKKPIAEAAMLRVREIILDADPRIADYVKYGSLMFGFEGDFATFVQADRKQVTLMFNRGARIRGAFPHLDGSGPSARFMRFADLDEVEALAGELAAVAVAWCTLVAH
jgi:hypothetical protein